MNVMWVLGVVALCLLSVAESGGICGPRSIRRHWSDCRKFVECGNNVTVVFQCPERSLFNPVTLVCDFSMFHECVVELSSEIDFFGVWNIMEAKPGSLAMDTRCNALPLGAKYRNVEDCSQFYHCSPSGPVLFQCPGNLLFDQRINVCNWPQYVNCDGIGPDTCPQGCIPDYRCPLNCELNVELLPHPGDCSSFFQCSDNNCACLQRCPEGLFWSSEFQRCMTRLASDCNDPEAPECPVCEPDDRCLDSDPNNPTLLPHPERCDAYMKCHQGKLCEVECPYGLEWHPKERLCVLPWGCTPTPPTDETPGETDPTTTETTPTTPTTPTTTTTTTTTMETSTTPKTTNGPVTTTTEPNGCPTCPPGVCKPDDRCPISCNECEPLLLPHSEACDMFLKCTHGYACEMRCPDGLHWSTALNRCEWPFLGDCGGGSTIQPPPSTPICDFNENCPLIDNPWDPTLLPVKDDCTKFIKCDNGRGCERDCPEGLHFSVQHNRCEWPHLAECDPDISPPDCPICPCNPCRMRQDRHPCIWNDVCHQNKDISVSLPYETDGDRFYECLSGLACLLDCPQGTRFSTRWNRCEDV